MVPGNESGVNSILREHPVRYESSVKMQFAGTALLNVEYIQKGGAWGHNRT
jgi:hypothetical protein